MNVDPEEIRRKARTARENSYNASQSEADLTKQKEEAFQQYKKLLDLCPDDIEAKIYTVLLNPMNLGFDTEGEGKRTEVALDVFVADLKESSLPFEEKEALITDVAMRVMVDARQKMDRMVKLIISMIFMLPTQETITEQVQKAHQQFATTFSLCSHFPSVLLTYPEGMESTKVRAAMLMLCEASLEVMIDDPISYQNDFYTLFTKGIETVLNVMKTMDPTGYHYIPLPKYEYWKNKSNNSMQKECLKLFNQSNLCTYINQHNARISKEEKKALLIINREKTDKYWREHPNRLNEIKEEIENVHQDIKQNDAKIKELNQQCKAAEAECDREPIPSSAEKKKLQQQIKTLEEQRAALGFFQFSEKNQLKKDLKQAQAAYEQALKDEPIQKEQKKEKKSRVVKEYQQKIEQVKKDNERLGKRLNSLRKELDNPLGLDPL